MRTCTIVTSFLVALTAATSVACSAPIDEEDGASSDVAVQEANEAVARAALPEEVRVVVQKDASSEKLCLVHEVGPDGAPGKLKASRCTVGGASKVGSEKCLLGGDGCWRVGRVDAWRAVRAEGNDALVDLIHLDGAHLSAFPGDDARVSVTREKKSIFAFMKDYADGTLKDGYLTTPRSGSKTTHTPASEWCVTLEEHGGDAVLGLKQYHSEAVHGPRDFEGCAIITLEPAQQVYAPLPAGMREGDDCSPVALAALALAAAAPDGATACHHGGMICRAGRWEAQTCSQHSSSSRSFCSRKGFCDASSTLPTLDAPCSNPTDVDAVSCAKPLVGDELTCQGGFWRAQSCASYASSSRSMCGSKGHCDAR
ncbi:MAG: hypothetical protein KIT84_41020 [Labilithrix sp.]|nr:hypothetical protein [Labilithrix sp.]MCW5817453.1 hypothetical protein [Labilithrix sp.]